ncbi:fasciclin domain-containing protein [Sphingomicrobium flavum]|uniref:fasciclin domain-containing protein n=1 Tax=Sphingomicrobium flavum TaxID=1229164 RepID=UPI0021ADAD7B|nr:fasciclin domain-containing protein [Sphingomicrobium flavum]
MTKCKLIAAATAAAGLMTIPAAAHDHKMAKKTIVETAVASDQFDTLETAVVTAGLAETLSGDGPFTVFAPTDDAFAKLPAGTVDTLLQPENRAQLTDILTYHVVAGRYTSGQIVAAAKKNGGTATLTTVQGGTLTAMLHGNDIMLHDSDNNMIGVVKANVAAKNGIIHAIDGVLMP